MSPKSYHAFTPYRHKSPKYKMILSTGGCIFLFLGLFIFGLFWFRSKPIISIKEEEENRMKKETTTDDTMMETGKKQTELFALPGKIGQAKAFRERQSESELFHFTLQAELPQIDENLFFYEAWLVRSFPFDFFSLGALQKKEEGIFVLEWLGEKGREQEFFSYEEVVVTIEKRDENPGPSEHILEGSF